MCDLFWIMCESDFLSYTDDNTPCISEDSIEDVIKTVEDDSISLFKLFVNIQMKANCNKCLLITSKQSCMNLKMGNMNIKISTCR